MQEKLSKILVLNYEFPPLGGGAANATYYLLKELSGRTDIKVDLITSSIGKYHEEKFAENITIYYLNVGKNGNLHFQSEKNLILYSMKSLLLGWKLRLKNKYDVTHAFFGIPCGFIAMLIGVPYIVSLRGSDVPFYNPRYALPDKYFFKFLSRFIWWRAKAVVANSEGLKELANRSSKKPIGVIFNGINIQEFSPNNTDKKNFVVLSTSRLTKRKGINYLVDGFAQFLKKHKEATLVLVGEGDRKDDLVNQVKTLGIEENVSFKGRVDHQEIVKIYQNASVFTLPSENEGMSNALLEAMACGLPIVATDTGGTKELVDGSNGVIIGMQSAEDICNALEMINNDPSKANEMGKSSRAKAEKLSWGHTAKQYIDIYKTV